jgi:excisionase family DNA binding protein
MAGMIANAMSSASQPQQQTPPVGSVGPAAQPSVMTLDEAAAYLRVTAADVQAMIDAGDLKAKKIGAEFRISKDAIDAFLAG